MRRLASVISPTSASRPSNAAIPSALLHPLKKTASRSARSRDRASTPMVAPWIAAPSRSCSAGRSGLAWGSRVTSISRGSGRSSCALAVPSQGSTRALSSSGGTGTAESTPWVRFSISIAAAICRSLRPSSSIDGNVTVTSLVRWS